MAYGFGHSDAGAVETVLVYDLGGGTFDVTVMVMSGGAVEVVTTDGDHELGGDDWDQRLVEIIRQKFMEQNPDADDPMLDPWALAEIKLEAESVKRRLSSISSAQVRVISGATTAMIEVTRDEFEEATRELLRQTVTTMKACLTAAAEKGSSTIDRVLLVGGSSLMPQVMTRVKEETGKDPELHDPNLAVAKGAALWGQRAGITAQIVESLSEHGPDVTQENLDDVAPELLDQAVAELAAEVGLSREEGVKLTTMRVNNVTSQGLGVKVYDEDLGRDVVRFMVHRNDALPASFEDTFLTVVDNQTQVSVSVWEQATAEEDQEVESNQKVVEAIIGPLPPCPAGTPVDLRFEMGDSGTLTVTAKHPGASQPLVLQFDMGRGVTDAEIAQSMAAMSRLTRETGVDHGRASTEEVDRAASMAASAFDDLEGECGTAGVSAGSGGGDGPRWSVDDRHIAVWLRERERHTDLPLRLDTPYVLRIRVGTPRDDSFVRGPQAVVPASDVPQGGLHTRWLLSSETVALQGLDADTETVPSSEGRRLWTAAFELLVPTDGNSRTVDLEIIPRAPGVCQIDIAVHARGELYRDLSVELKVEDESPRGRARGDAVQVSDNVICPASQLGGSF